MVRRPRGDNVRINATIQDENDNPVNPTTTVITIWSPTDIVLVSAAAMTSTGTTGEFFYNHQTAVGDATGIYIVRVDGTIAANTGRQDSRFELYDPLLLN